MLLDSRFLHYRVSINRGSDDYVLELLTPYVLWSIVDEPLWTRIAERKLEEDRLRIRIQQIAVYTSIYEYEMKGLTPFNLLENDSTLRFLWKNLFTSYHSTASEEKLLETLAGRQLLLNEVNKIYAGLQMNHLPLETLQQLYLQGFFDWRPAIVNQGCQRCGYGQSRTSNARSKGANRLKRGKWLSKLRGLPIAETVSLQTLKKFTSRADERLIAVPCARCGSKSCLYCPHCISLGKARACEPLLLWKAEIKQNVTNVRFVWSGELSPVQQQAADQLFSFIHQADVNQEDVEPEQVHHGQSKQKPRRVFLLWAVCGAGKTEILFPTIHQSLLRRHKILIASPRRDVITELAPRLQSAFPQSRIRVLHAESEERFAVGDIYVATTHQTLRFVNYFDVAIIDEEDAFPMHHDPVLGPAVHRALKDSGTVVYLTATPRKQMQRQALQGELAYALIPQRYHGHPLAVPNICPLGNWRKQISQGALLTPLIHYLLHLNEQRRFGYLFLPRVDDLHTTYAYLQKTLIPYLQEIYPHFPQDWRMEMVHASHPERTAIVQRFRDQQIHLLLTTTILERGVTIPYSDVAVLGSDDPVFDTAALIQIAGRVGRKEDDPVGQVWFFPEARTNAQVECLKQIKEWNRLAGELVKGGSL